MCHVLFLLLAILCRAQFAAAQDEATSATLTSRGLFRIGYLRREETGHPGEGALDDLKKYLLANHTIDSALRAEGHSGIGIFPCDGPADMLRRLNAREFDVAFTPASLYLQQQSGYTAILMARRPGDTFSATNTVLRYGVVIVSPRSPLFSKDKIQAEDIRSALHSGRPIGVVSTQSAAGFYAPLLTLAVQYKADPISPGLTYYETSEEVVKAVVSGLVDIGACEDDAIDRVLKSAGLDAQKSRMLRVIVRTDPTPTDPIVVKSSLAERNNPLVRALAAGIRDFFVAQRSDVQYVPTDDREYGRLEQMLKEFNLRFGQLNP
ncbi:PhnD/SsuA/transferrin family substrate-binding protein [Candidatus Sumerlaeota bacterium]|nr:PhnD/SsuA/transferrin family substrate-binding protein [Candidatus Sumerlaeota bacterium]